MSRKGIWIAGGIAGIFLLLGVFAWQAMGYVMRLWLWTSSATCDLQMRDTALAFGVGVDTRTSGGETPLMIAARSGCRTHVLEFIRRGADVNATDKRGLAPLYNAAEVGDAKTVSILLRSGANPNIASRQWGLTPLMRAAERGHAQVVRDLLAAGADPGMKDWRGRTALDYAKKGSYPEHRIIEQLLQEAGQSPPARR